MLYFILCFSILTLFYLQMVKKMSIEFAQLGTITFSQFYDI